jgi:murein DD-endopeptidase MepM/ murein hydrolase activator NlpD
MLLRKKAMIRCRSLLPLLVALFAITPALAQTQKDSAIKNVFWQPNELQNGSVVFFGVELNREATRVTGKFLGKDLAFFKAVDRPRTWYSLAGVDIDSAPAGYDLTVVATVAGRPVRTTKKVDVTAATFGTGSVDVPENYVNPDEAGKKKIAADGIWKARAFRHFLRTPQWSGDFVKPVDAPSTPSFGMTRLLNEELTSRHRGTDFPIKEGTPVVASNSGTVVLARELFYEGNCVIIDHGQHFFTEYMHLSKIDVKVGQQVKKSQRIGLTGATGRVTGPHLHMGVRWETSYLDPTKLLALTLPETHKTLPAHPIRRRRR